MFGEGTEEPELAGRWMGRKVTVTAEESARGGAARGSEGASDGSWRSEQEYEVFGGTLGAEGLHVCVKGAFRSWGSPVCVGALKDRMAVGRLGAGINMFPIGEGTVQSRLSFPSVTCEWQDSSLSREKVVLRERFKKLGQN